MGRKKILPATVAVVICTWIASEKREACSSGRAGAAHRGGDPCNLREILPPIPISEPRPLSWPGESLSQDSPGQGALAAVIRGPVGMHPSH